MCTCHVYTTLHGDGHRETSRKYVLCSASRHGRPCADVSVFTPPPTHRPSVVQYPSPPSSRSSSAARYTVEEYYRRPRTTHTPVIIVDQARQTSSSSPKRVRIQDPAPTRSSSSASSRRERIQRQIQLDNAEIARRPYEPQRSRSRDADVWDRMREEELRVRIEFLNRQEQWAAERLRMRERAARQPAPEHWRRYRQEYRWP
ncbi:hypothetical protein CDD82_2487 [Ophiocordyceps australis]|uniref:Uncharacterized protein n=1 Tax=Ophiocordyceps australis TaxID=1399860 RepID=A0A2C5XSH5_9HYPO|nr:hypothetical protein CDD82_2487 [Ophiocordyceps australis]